MKILKSISSVVALTALLSATSMSASAETLTVTGHVAANSCIIPADQMTRTIDIPAFQQAAVSEASDGQTLEEQAFSFSVSGCPSSVSRVGVKFSYQPDATNPFYMANTGDATGVAFAIADAANNLVANNTNIMSADYDNSTGAGSINAKVRAFRTAADAGAGDITSTATVEIVTP